MGDILRRKYKLLFIIFISIIITFLIYISLKDNKLSITALGDGISSGYTNNKIDGISYNDYLYEYFNNRRLLKYYNNDYSYKDNTIDKLLNDINNNSKKDDYILHILNKSNIIIINFGMEELSKISIVDDISLNDIRNIIYKYDLLLNKIQEVSDAKIVIISAYNNKYVSKGYIIAFNNELLNLKNKYNFIFINIIDLVTYNSGMYIDHLIHKKIANMIINSI